MSRQIMIEQLRTVLAIGAAGLLLAVFGLLCLWIGYRRGWHRGVNDQPQKLREALAQATFERGVAEERMEMAEKTSKRFEVAMLQLAEAARQNGRAQP